MSYANRIDLIKIALAFDALDVDDDARAAVADFLRATGGAYGRGVAQGLLLDVGRPARPRVARGLA